ncbi:MAG: pyridoxal phosphate-dependent aminotransferase [Bacteriovoracaceae bacterium]
MFLSSRIKNTNLSLTLKMNERAQDLHDSGVHVYNLTSGQLPFKPIPELNAKIISQVNFLKSFQYSPPSGFPELKEKVLKYMESSRGINLPREKFDCIVSNGAKHSIYNALGAMVDPGDEVVIVAPYWISYPEMIKFWGGVPIVVTTKSYNAFVPDIDELRKVLTSRTKMLILNSPNNPSGVNYSEHWMDEFANLMQEFPDTLILSDEIYYDLFYYDPKPTYYYQNRIELLDRTLIVDGISKTQMGPGLRLGYCVGPKKIIDAMTLIQSQTTSGPSSLIQRALIELDWSKNVEFLTPIKTYLRRNADALREAFKNEGLDNCWYQTTGAFYFMVDFSITPCFSLYKKDDNDQKDYSIQICDDLLKDECVAIIPGSDFGLKNSARISLTLEKEPFEAAMEKLTHFLSKEK